MRLLSLVCLFSVGVTSSVSSGIIRGPPTSQLVNAGLCHYKKNIYILKVQPSKVLCHIESSLTSIITRGGTILDNEMI